MNIVTLENLTEKLKYAPSPILEKIWEYADALLEKSSSNFVLSDEQKKHLKKQNNVPLEDCTDANAVYKQLVEKHEL
ncbi:hypothetical protein ABIB40_002563 [Pedobacter sp. UYP30]|uniref:hypothetical protein n=1 Tax=Pedobacter sp. UYP30 TaxID=1756400 RepID=UPI0033920B09